MLDIRKMKGALNFQRSFSKCSFPTPQAGHVQLSGMSSNAVPGAIPFSGSPSAGSYMYPQMIQTYFSIKCSSIIVSTYAYQILSRTAVVLKSRKNTLKAPWGIKFVVYLAHYWTICYGKHNTVQYLSFSIQKFFP